MNLYSNITEYCENLFFESDNSDKLLVFLPSVNGGKNYPYYPRKSWSSDFSDKYNVLFISDPYQNLLLYLESMGSWFISPDGESTIEILAEKIVELKDKLSLRDVLFYGSSMGGYAAIILSSLIAGSKAISECPQLYLSKHPGSRYVCNNILKKTIDVNLIEPLHFLREGKSKHIRLVCSIFDNHHYLSHILPFVEDIKGISNINISIELYANDLYKNGHVALNKIDAFKLIEEVMNSDFFIWNRGHFGYSLFNPR